MAKFTCWITARAAYSAWCAARPGRKRVIIKQAIRNPKTGSMYLLPWLEKTV